MQSIDTFTDYRQRIRRVMIHINNQLDKQIRLDQLSELACFSPFHFIRVFEAVMGETPQQYVFKKRMEQSGFNLLRRDWSVTDITFSVAYETPSSFCKAFKSYYGIPPRKFRDTTPEHIYHKTHHNFRSFNHVRKKSGNVLLPTIKHLPSIKVICIDNIGAEAASFRATAPQSFSTFKTKIAQEDLAGTIGLQISIYPFRPSSFKDPETRSFVGATINQKFESIPGFKYLTLPAGKYAIFNHFGSFDFLIQTWNQAYSNWLPRSGRKLRDAPPAELHMDTVSTPDPLQLSAYLIVPIL
jgi:AraC-like DNA-binding protein/DNA gyrase inhibitor GyrI